MDKFDLRLWEGFEAAGGNITTPAFIDQVIIDSRRLNSSEALFVALSGTQDDGHKFVSHVAEAGARFALVRKDWMPPASLPAHFTLLKTADPLKAFQEIAQTYRKHKNAVVIGVTGSYGKTMVKDLLQAMTGSVKQTVASPESFNSQIGVPLSLLTITSKHEIAIIEAGISKKNEMDILADMIDPDCVVLTHVGKKHLHTLGNLDSAASEKIKLATKNRKKNWVLIPQTEPLKTHLSKISDPLFFWNTASKELPHAESTGLYDNSSMSYKINFPDGNTFTGEAHFGFYYYLDLINITVKAAWLLGIPSQAICKALETYSPEPIRTEIWKSPIGATFINDTYSSDPQSVDLSLRYLQQAESFNRKIFIFGGMRGDHPGTAYKRIGQAISRSHLEILVLVGPSPFFPLIEEVTRQSPPTEIIICADYREALSTVKQRIKSHDFVLIKGKCKESLDIITETFNDSICNNQCVINAAAIESNIATLRNKLAPGTRIMVMVKALAYGTDEVRMAKFLKTYGIDILGVSYVDEGVTLKRAGVSQEIFVINAATYEAAKIVKWELSVGVSEKEFIQAVANEAARQNKKIKVHLHVDTGMSRFGCRPEETLHLAKMVLKHPSLILDGIMTHFACADNPQDDLFTLQQSRTFDAVIKQLEDQGINLQWKHACNSSAAMRFDFPQYTMARIGLAVYGLYPSEAAKESLELRLALSLTSRIVGINHCKKGETISYGRSYEVMQEQQRIAVLPIGYFDGLHRNYSGKGYVIIRGMKAPMVGNICMDFMMVDVTNIPNARIGDSVLIFGEDDYGNYLSPEDLASRGDSIVYELITCLGPRIQRIFVHEEAHHLR